MPNCFTLTRKGDIEPTALVALDEELCRHLGVEVHPVRYVEGWYDTIGLALACGIGLHDAKLDDILADCATLHTILAYLREHFVADCWAQRH